MNAYLELAEQQIPAPVKARQRAAETRAQRATEKALAGRDAQFRLWKQGRREQIDIILAGPHGTKLTALLDYLEHLTLESTSLVERVRDDNWPAADDDTRFLVLHLVNATIVRLREQAGLPTFDDPLFDRPPNAFLVLRELLR